MGGGRDPARLVLGDVALDDDQESAGESVVPDRRTGAANDRAAGGQLPRALVRLGADPADDAGPAFEDQARGVVRADGWSLSASRSRK